MNVHSNNWHSLPLLCEDTSSKRPPICKTWINMHSMSCLKSGSLYLKQNCKEGHTNPKITLQLNLEGLGFLSQEQHRNVLPLMMWYDHRKKTITWQWPNWECFNKMWAVSADHVLSVPPAPERGRYACGGAPLPRAARPPPGPGPWPDPPAYVAGQSPGSGVQHRCPAACQL